MRRELPITPRTGPDRQALASLALGFVFMAAILIALLGAAASVAGGPR